MLKKPFMAQLAFQLGARNCSNHWNALLFKKERDFTRKRWNILWKIKLVSKQTCLCGTSGPRLVGCFSREAECYRACQKLCETTRGWLYCRENRSKVFWLMLQDEQKSQPPVCMQPGIPPEDRTRLDGVLPWPPQRQCPRRPGSDALQGRGKQSPTFKTRQTVKTWISAFSLVHNCSHPNTSTRQCQGLRHSVLGCISLRLWQGEAGSHLGALVLDSEGSVLLPGVAHGWLSLEAVSNNSSFQWTHMKMVSFSVLLSGSGLLCPSGHSDLFAQMRHFNSSPAVRSLTPEMVTSLFLCWCKHYTE